MWGGDAGSTQRGPCSRRRSCGYVHVVTRRCAQRCRPANMSRAVCAPCGHFATLSYIGRSLPLVCLKCMQLFLRERFAVAARDALLHAHRRPLVQPYSPIWRVSLIFLTKYRNTEYRNFRENPVKKKNGIPLRMEVAGCARCVARLLAGACRGYGL